MSRIDNYMTPAGYEALVDELETLRTVERPKVVQEVSDAAAQGDRSENAEYIYGKKRLREIDGRMNKIASWLKDVILVDPAKQQGSIVVFGATVKLEDQDGREVTWKLVGEFEPAPDQGRISWKSPMGRALLQRSVGDTVTVRAPRGDRDYTILALLFT